MSSIIQQLKLWDQLIEQRIKFEELMHKCNSLPQENTWSKLTEIDKDGKLLKYQKLAEEKLLKLFEECVQFEKTVEQLNPNLLDQDKLEIKKTDESNGKLNSEEDDSGNNSEQDFGDNSEQDEQMELDESEENYESDLNDEDDLNEENDSEDQEFDESDCEPFNEEIESNQINDDLNNLIEFNLDLNNDLNETIEKTEIYLSNKYEKLKNVRNEILNYWFEKTRFTLRGGKLDKNSLDAFEQSTVKSIDHLLLNRLKLIQRTQLKRGNYEIIGKKEQDDEQINSELVEKKKKEIYDCEIFDDSDFYHQLLRELVNSLGASNLNNTTKVNPKWLKLMKERFKANKYVDTKATKARKIRYKVHNLLINFMTPMTHLNQYDDEQHSNLIKSIFGKTTTDLNDNLDLDSSDSD